MNQTIIAIPDIHAPFQDDEAIEAALRIIEEEKPQHIVFLGDLVDFVSISRFDAGSWEEAMMTADKEIESANSILDKFQPYINNAKSYFCIGNHEERLLRFFLKHAFKLGRRYTGNTVEEQLRLSERGITVIPPDKQPFQIDNCHMRFMHGQRVTKYHSAHMLQDYGESLMYGHTHDHQSFIGPHLHDKPPSVVMSVGCLCRYDQHYIGNKPTRWMHGVGKVVYNHEGMFQADFKTIIDGKAIGYE